MRPWCSLELFTRLLNLLPEAGLRRMYAAALSPSAKLVEPLLSVARYQGCHLGEVGEARLSMAVDRLDTYDHILKELRKRTADVVPLKGLEIAAYYPAGLVRGCVDLDVFVPDPNNTWELAEYVHSSLPVKEKNISVIRSGGGYDIFVGMTWASPHSALDSIYRVELSSLPFLGDRHGVPPRPGLPASGLLLQLLLVAEEQFQRGIGGRDILDTLILLDTMAEDLAEGWVEKTASAHLAPEMKALFTAAAEAIRDVEGGSNLYALASCLAEQLTTAARLESERRLNPAAKSTSLTGQIVEYGLPIDDTVTEHARFTEYDFGTVLFSPLGSYLLTAGLEVSEELYERACATVSS